MILGKLVEALRLGLYDPLSALPRQKVQFEFSIGRLDVVLDSLPLVGRQTVEDQYQGLPATMHQDLEHLDEQSRVHPSLVGREPEAAQLKPPRPIVAGPARVSQGSVLSRPMSFPAPHRRGIRIHPRNKSRRLAFLPVLQCLDRCRVSMLQLQQGHARKRASMASAASIPTSPEASRQPSRQSWPRTCPQSTCAPPAASTNQNRNHAGEDLCR